MQIMATHQAVENLLDAEVQAAATTGNSQSLANAKERQRLNGFAYFVLCWGQFEADIDDKCRNEIRKRRSHPHWPQRRGWDIYNPDEKRLSGLSFLDRVALLTDKSAGNGSAWADIFKLYQTRNLLAHGKLAVTEIDVQDVGRQMYQLQSEL